MVLRIKMVNSLNVSNFYRYCLNMFFFLVCLFNPHENIEVRVPRDCVHLGEYNLLSRSEMNLVQLNSSVYLFASICVCIIE